MKELTFDEKRQRIKEIEGQIEILTLELRDLLCPALKEKPKRKLNGLPDGFNLRSAVLRSIEVNDGKSSKESIVYAIRVEGVQVTPEQVQGALSNLKAEGKLEIVGRGVYALKIKEKDPSMGDAEPDGM